ncbi:5-oxoprolinase subunit PxpB [Sabulilitoribacter multivorans]|uniref:5-oxoprolinase subunit PxpB n=1 Tax=Flaviramulus multivorans TaxID=1304750 RepID=A0ABS9IHC6_9FLAO|nr:5-oxoprolinase subunit PxpB [Flaviramulus multivorans]MCF7560164.1 5-oxoprolinase subunit PxpB [Flaviramulus multivorans]
MAFKLTYKPFGERAILIEWPQKIDKSVLKDILLYKEKIQIYNTDFFLDLRVAYNSLLVIYKNSINNFSVEVSKLKDIYLQNSVITRTIFRKWKIPVCYDETFGLDLEFISKEKNISKANIIKRHSQAIYTVYFIGFLPGFLYLGGLDEILHTPRKPSPRLRIEKGAVAIGGNQTGIYPNESPGGWNIIGNAPINFFDVSKSSPCFAMAGDSIQFYPVTLDEYHHIKTLVEAGVYQIESEVFDD